MLFYKVEVICFACINYEICLLSISKLSLSLIDLIKSVLYIMYCLVIIQLIL